MNGEGPGLQVRATAADTVARVLGGASLKAQLAGTLGRFGDPRDRALYEAMCFESLRWRRRYEDVLGKWMRRPLPAREARLHALLLVGLAQLDAMGMSSHAAVAATAGAARFLGRPDGVALVNALLRRATREAWPESDEEAVRLSHPDWLVQRLRADWPRHAEALLDANNRPAPMWLRVNRRQIGVERYLEQLAAAGFEAEPVPWLPAAVRLAAAVAPTRLPGWRVGHVSVQDGAAQLAALALDPAAGARVLDACAAPGGKTAQLLEADPDLDLTAIDLDAGRLERLAANLRRLRIEPPARMIVADARRPADWWDGRAYDAVLLDAPCSATGIIRRQPDIKWHRRESDVGALVELQAGLLDALWPTLAPGGVLVYATCSVLQAENARQVEAFLERTPDARAEPLDACFGLPAGPGRQRLTGSDGTDGFFHARLRRTGPPP